jgi:hypothetical protein
MRSTVGVLAVNTLLFAQHLRLHLSIRVEIRTTGVNLEFQGQSRNNVNWQLKMN